MSTIDRVTEFLNANGWKEDKEQSDEYKSFFKENNISIDINDDEVVLIDTSGDFMHIKINNLSYYTLLGALIHNRAIAMDFVN